MFVYTIQPVVESRLKLAARAVLSADAGLLVPIVDVCLSCEDTARQSYALVPRWRILAFFGSCVSSEPRAAYFQRIRTKATPYVEVW